MNRLAVTVAACALAMPALADEGMWLFNQFPIQLVRTRHNFEVTPQFLNQLRLASLRLGGGSGAFVSPRGLIVTNHHVAADCIQKLSSAQRDYMKDGFFAATENDELRCPDLEGNVLVGMEVVTKQVNAAVKEGAEATEVNAQRKAAIARIEKECTDKTGNLCEVVTLYGGQRFDLYQYKKYTDLRLVFAPEFLMAFFGGDNDNFTYPRYDLDVAFLRAYENGKPLQTPVFLKWSREGAQDGELVFVSGSPGSTSRLLTMAQASFVGGTRTSIQLGRLTARITALQEFSLAGEENRRMAQRLLFSFTNTYKGQSGRAAGLRDQKLMLRRRGFEARVRGAVERDPKQGVEAAKVWDQVAAAYKAWSPNERAYQTLERYAAQGSSLFRIARHIVRLAEECEKPNGERLPDYRDSARPSLELTLYSPAPIDDPVEALMLSIYLDELAKVLGEKDTTVKTILAGRTSLEAATAMVAASKLKDVAERKRLTASKEALAASEDPIIRLARQIDEPARKIRKKYEDSIESLEATTAARIAGFRYKLFGTGESPDATRTPRVSFGVIKAYKDRAEVPAPWATTFSGLYHRATNEDPYRLPPRWVEGKAKLNLVTPFNFVSTADITGGNSGSPTVNRKGELVGIVFDGNMESLPNTFLYSDEYARAVHVATQGIVEALVKLYPAGRLLDELGVKR